jgi:hypothetical protein
MSTKTKLRFKKVSAVPSLRVAEITLASGQTARALSVGRDNVHFALDDGDEVTFTGPGIAALAIDWGGIMDSAIEAGRQVLASGGQGGGKGHCTTRYVVNGNRKGGVDSVTISVTCTSD